MRSLGARRPPQTKFLFASDATRGLVDGVDFLFHATLPVWLGVGALHPRLDRVSTFRLTGTHRNALRRSGRNRTHA